MITVNALALGVFIGIVIGVVSTLIIATILGGKRK